MIMSASPLIAICLLYAAYCELQAYLSCHAERS